MLKMRLAWLSLALGLGALILAVGYTLWQAAKPHTFAGVGPTRPAADFTLTDEAGQSFTLSDLRGRWVLLAYGYTTCPDVCPATLNNLRQVKAALGEQAPQVQVVFVSVDPERDSVAVLAQYVQRFGADFKGLTGSPAEVALAAQAYDVKYKKQDIQTAVGYLVSHSAFVYLIDPDFQLRLTFPFGVKPAEIAADLQYLMAQEER